MILKRKDYGAPYFGDPSQPPKHDAEYSNYIELHTNWRAKRSIKKFLIRHNIPKNAKILEGGAGIGFMGKIATEEGYTNWTCVDWSNWCKRHEVYPVIEQDVLSYLQAQADNSFDYIITHALIECIPLNQLQALATEAKRVGIKQIHATYIQPNAQFYEVKTLPEWATVFLNDLDVIIEDHSTASIQ